MLHSKSMLHYSIMVEMRIASSMKRPLGVVGIAPLRTTPRPYTTDMSQSLPKRHPLHTERLHLEILHEDHADEMFSVLRNPIIYRYMDGRPDTPEALRQQYEKQSSNWDGRPISWHTWIMRGQVRRSGVSAFR